jgi:arylsulfatase A-like enzyme
VIDRHTMPVYHQMLWDADLYVGRLVDAVKRRGLYENSIWVYSADNVRTTLLLLRPTVWAHEARSP